MRPRITLLLVVTGVLALLPSCRSENTYVGTFETLWKKVDETYFDTTFGGLDWKSAHDRYLPRIAAARRDEDFYGLVNTMLWELNVSHANLVPPGMMARREPLVCAEGGVGIDVRVLGGATVVTSVKPGSPAGQADLRAGYLIQAVDGVPVEQIVQEAQTVVRPPNNSRNRVAVISKAILGRIYGPPGTEVSIAYSDEGGKKTEKRMVRTKRDGVALGPRGALYLAVEFETRRLGDELGYVRLNTLQPPLVTRVSSAIRSMGHLRGLVLDLRGNAGGEIEGMPGLFLRERTLLYLRRSRNGETKVFVDPARDVCECPLVVLVDELSGSAGELFAACLQATGRAVVAGGRSPGAVTESDMTVLRSGAIFMYPVARLATPDGTVLEGHGVVPNIEVALDREMLLKGIDSQLQAAVGYLGKVPPR